MALLSALELSRSPGSRLIVLSYYRQGVWTRLLRAISIIPATKTLINKKSIDVTDNTSR